MNLANRITLIRILLIPVLVFFYMADFIPYGKLVALIVFVIACFTDFLDGYIARSRNMVTNLGKFFDSIADKILVMTGLVLLVAFPITPNSGTVIAAAIYPQYVGLVAAIIILAREFIISAFRQIAATKNVVMAADIYGKVKAVFQFVTLIFYFVYAFVIEEFYVSTSDAWVSANAVLNVVGYVLLAVTIAMTIVSAWKYISNNRKVLKEESK